MGHDTIFLAEIGAMAWFLMAFLVMATGLTLYDIHKRVRRIEKAVCSKGELK